MSVYKDPKIILGRFTTVLQIGREKYINQRNEDLKQNEKPLRGSESNSTRSNRIWI